MKGIYLLLVLTPLFSSGQKVPTKTIKQTNEIQSQLLRGTNTDSIIHKAVLKTIDNLKTDGY